MTDRRAVLTGLAASALASAPAVAAAPRAVSRHYGYRPWRTARKPSAPPLDGKVSLPNGRELSLREWIGPGPSVIILWALWCPPCMAENPALAGLQRKLTAMKSNTRLRCLQAYDNRSLADAGATLTRMRCSEIPIARASVALERAFIPFFGASPIDPKRTSLPSMVLLDSSGVELGRAEGALEFERQIYWSDPRVVEFLAGLEGLLRS